ncbi:LOW QUALITY PROTEIN: zonadhesin isoform X1, partial [Cricetulus griseus]|uniref:LOW QUALITY PROTEIN: zonadhesin isoform X1 n=1 Tax=Cricetulus griseus TaxID=10029 RepID=UPI0015C30CCA
MAPPVWTLMLLVGTAWGQHQVSAPMRRQNSLERKPIKMALTSQESSILSKCDFEDDTRPFCDWSQMSSDDGDWIRTTGPSSTGTSGPPGGYPNGEGYYLHMDASTFPRGGVARLRSPDIWEQGPLCIHFAFHMFGLSWGAQLRLLLLRGRNHRRPNILWKHINTQSLSWMPTTVNVPANRDIPSWLMFEGMRGNTAYLDISLDGLSIQRGTCNRICLSQLCTFDILNDLCGWSWVPTATGAKWTQKTGPSEKPGVGPDDDFSSPGRGYYMLLDSTNARSGQKAVLLSPLSHSSGCLTLSFYYIMRGQSVGEGLFVYATFLGNIRKHTLFSGHYGPTWQAVSVNYTGQGQLQFMVVGVFGDKPEPAIAVDAISIAPCGERFPQCNFEDRLHPFCDWSNVLGDSGHWRWGSKSVPTPISGPPREFPYGGEHYIYFDSVNLPQAGQSAKLVSPPFCAPGDVCVEFAYHMYGLGEGTTLKLLLGSPAGSAPISLWNRVGSQSTGWVNSSVTIPKGHQQPMQLFLEATRGSSTAFVVAVNFILISHGPCRGKMELKGPASSPPQYKPSGSYLPALPQIEIYSTSVPIVVPFTPTEENTISTERTTIPPEEITTSTEMITAPTEETTEETTIPTEVTIGSPEETTTPTEVIITPVSPEETSIPLETTSSTEATTVSIEETTSSTEVTTVSPEETTTPTEVTTVSTEVNAASTEVASASTEVTTVSPEETTIPTEMTTVSTEVTGVSTEVASATTEVTTVSPEETTIPTEVITVPPEETTIPIELTTVPPEETTFPTEVTTVPPEETTFPTEVTTVPPEETTFPTEVTTVPPEETTFPTEVTTVPPEETTFPTEVTTVPPEETTFPTEVTTVPPEETTFPTEVTTVPPEETTFPTEVTTVPPEETTFPTEVTTVPPEETTFPTEVTTVPPEETTFPTEVTTVPPEETTFPTEVTTVPPEETTFPTEVTTVPPEETTFPTEVTTVPPEETTFPTEVTTVPPEETTFPTEVTTVPPEETTFPTEVTTVPPEETTFPTEVTTVPPEETTFPTEVTTVPPEETTFPTEVTTVPPEETTFPTEVTTVPPEETTFPTEVTTVPPEETTFPIEVTTVHPEETTFPIETSGPPEVTSIFSEGAIVSMEETTVFAEHSTFFMQTSTICSPPCPSPSQVPGVSMIGLVPAIGISTTAMRCPPYAHFESCACLASCENPKPSCQSPCSPGCVCNPGFLFSNNQCINESFCNCFYSNKYYQPGEEWFSPNCTERCRCLLGSRLECQISQCGTHTVCQLNNGQYECQPYGTATCLVYGDLHFVTFDERQISFTGTCTYILTQICDNSTDPFFKITASAQERGVEGVASLDKVFITLPETTITLIRGRHTLIGDQSVTLPAIPSNGIFVGLSGRFVELRTAFGLRVRWDGDQQLFVTVSSTYSKKLCGFCGNYDGDGSNDNRKPDGIMTEDEDELGNSWKIEEDKDLADCLGWVFSRCQNKKSTPSCDSALGRIMSGTKLCGQLVDPRGPFETCLFHMKASSFLDNCVMDMCSFQGLQQMLCVHMSAMTATCQDAGYAVGPWRGPQFCPLVCPQNSRYSLCAKPCPDTCHPGSALQPCQEQCVEACECDPGFILSGFECVPQSKCGCTNVEGRYFEIQEQWFNPDCKEICTCEGNNNIRCRPWKCKAQEACIHKNGILGCHAQGAATCIASGDPHYLTFDGALHNFMGTCTYVLTRPCWSNIQENNFVVSVTNEIRDGNLEVSNVKAVHVQVFDLKISLFKGRRVVLNNQRVTLPVWPLKGRVTIRSSGIFVLLYTNFGLQVRYDGNHLVEVTVPSSYTGSLCGLCGNYNNNSLDDNLRPDRKPAGSSLLLGASWKILEASEPGCFVVRGKSSSCEENNMDDTWTKRCAILMNPIGPFSNCHEAVPPQASFSSCVYAQCGTKGDTLALCRSLQAYATLCAQAGQVTTWRNSTFCPLRCQPGSSYNPCANPCPATCLTLSTPKDCPALPCVEGCECQKGYILSGTTCVPLRHCGCSDQGGSYHLLGESWYTERTCTTLCTCSIHSNVTCSPTACEANHVCLRQDGLLRCAAEMGECHISEDSQIVSFDGHIHPIQDMCTYVLVKVCHPNMNLPFFTISAKTDKDTLSKTRTFSVYQIYIDIFSFRVTLQKKHTVLVSWINDTQVTLPATTQIPGISITTEDVYTIVTIKDEVQVKFESNSFLDIKIPASSNGKVCGVCGNFNGEEEDELMTSNEELAQDEQEFMDSWKDKDIDPNCQKIEEQNIQVEQQEIMNGKCRPDDFEKAQANCEAALQGPAWAQCASRVPLKPFLLGCMNNFCEFRELFRALCEALQSFEDACQNQGLKPPIWRNSSFCPLECPAHSHYTNCLPSCPPSCLDPDSRCEGSGHKVPATCKEGCICQPGYVLNNDKCVLKTHCGCKDAQGVFVPAGKTWMSTGCTQTCACTRGAIRCRNFQCPLGTHCKDNNDGSSNCVKIIFQCPAHSQYTDCLPSCHPSCSDPEGHCEGISTKAPATCKEGCVCQPGYVLRKDKCVLKIECGCQDTQGGFIPAGKTWISRGCTQSCTCMGGAIQCRNFQCPPGTYCKDSDDGNSNCAKITLQCPAHSQYTNCLPSCLPSCLDLEGHCGGISTKAPATCKEGCVCQPGYVLNNDKCMLKIECDCQDTQGVFIPVSKTWTSRGCTQSCTCVGGVIQCRNFQCPPGTYCKDTNDGNSNCTKITLQCPAHTLYTNCLPSCLPSCSDPDGLCMGTSPKAPSSCKEGCVCRSGFVLHNDKCMLRIRCGCKDTQGVLIPANKTWINRGCTQSCTCSGGAILCRKFQCPPETYCKDIEDGNSNCTKITLQCPAHSQYTDCLPSCQPSCSDPDGRCVGSGTKGPSTCKEGCACQPGYVLDNDKCMLRIQCGCKDAQGVLIPADKTWINRGCTQSCICMGGVIQCQKFHCPSETYCKNTEDGNSNCAKITLQCPVHSHYTNCLPSCPPTCSDPEGHCEDVSTKAPSTCKEGCVCQPNHVLHNHQCMLRTECGCKDAQGVLIPADKTWINRGCTQSCTCSGGAILCRKFQCPPETYCKNIEDGNSNCTKITLQCPANSHFTDCLPSCQPSCSNVKGHCEDSSPKAPSTCKEGCICQPGYVLQKDQCILRTECGCKDAQGALIPEGKTWITRGCTQSCTCIEGVIQCRTFQCPLGTYCKSSDDVNSSCVKITLQCPAHSRYSNCLPFCPPTCLDPEGLCGSTSPKAPSTCKEGCVCRPGFVLHNDKCMLRILCDCKDAQGTLIPADKTWITRGCTQSCTCVAGVIHCKNIQCPPGTYCKNRDDGSTNCTKITLQCPTHSQFTDCLPSCLPSCSNHCEITSPKGPSNCKEGCLCDHGFVLNENKCVPRTECGCKDARGTFIPAGKTWTSKGCTQSCACTEGNIQCQNFHCPSETYCKDNSDDSSTCVKITLQCPAHTHFTSCLPSCLPSCSDPGGLCKGTSPKAPATCKEGCICQPDHVLHNDKCILRIQCDCKDAHGALIPAGKTWISTGCTQSCACMEGAVQCQDFKCPSGTYCKNNNEGSSNCAKITLQCPDHSLFTDCLPSCLPSCLDPEGLCKETSPKAPSTCKEGCVCEPGLVLQKDTCVLKTECGCKDAHGALIPVSKTWVSRGCTQSCTCTGGIIQCQSFQCPPETYCKNSNDDSSNCVKIPLQCPANSQYTDCLPRCPPTCLDPEGHCEGTGPTGPSTCKEGCVCQPGYVIDKDKCVLRMQCDCKDAHGVLIPAGKTWTPRGCNQSCTCMAGAVQCRNFQCPSGTYCKDSNDGSSNCARIPLQCPAHSLYTDCLPSCQPSCLDPDAHCEGITPKAPSTCKEGCSCQPGYVLANDKCVLKIECGCKGTQGGFIPAGKTWIATGCSQSCTCVGGTIECRNFLCPSGTYCKDRDDGSSNCAKITLQCPDHSHFTSCLPSCPPSCLNLDGRCEGTSPQVPSTCKEGCLCQPGYFLNKNKCVLQIHCDCLDARGTFIPAGKTWTSRGCTQNCPCAGGAIQCQNFQCPSGTYCKDSSDGNSNCAKISKGVMGEWAGGVLMAGGIRALQCPAHSQFTSCLPSCPPSCAILDGHCEEASSKVPTTCKEGCICRPGYLLNNDKCVLRIQCSCNDGHGGLIPAGKTWINEDCTETCNCMGGTIQCRNFQCPPGTYCKNNNDDSRNCAKITLQCPAHSRYTNCLPPCLPSCANLDGLCGVTISKVSSTCKEGCICQPGYVLNNNKCVLQIHCGCKNAQGDLIPAGKTWTSRGCTQCWSCVGGAVQCHNFNCPSGTQCQDDQDGNSSCAKITLQCPTHSRYTNCLPSCLPSCADPEGLCGGTSPKAPSTCKEGCVCRAGFVLHNNKCVLRIQCACKDAHGVLIPVNKTWISKGCTQNCTCLAGNIRCRDFHCPSGTRCKDNGDGSSNCAKVVLECPDNSHHTNCLPSCIPSCSNLNEHCEVEGLRAPSICKEGCLCQPGFVLNKDKCIPRIQCGCKDSQGTPILAGKTWISTGCSQKCTCVEGLVHCHDFKCPAGTQCQDIEEGSSNCVENTFQCPAHSRFTNCLPSCLPSCLDPDAHCKGTSPKAPAVCKAGCLCQSGYVLSNDKCILRIQCGCKDAQGALIPEGKTWISRGCIQSCACKGGAVQCRDFKCPAESHCQLYEDGSSSCVTSALKCPAHSFYTNCLPSCLPSCLDPEGLCKGSSPKAPSTCKEGCVCRSGYVLQNNKCMLRIHCACKLSQGNLIQAGQSWISSDCTQICACKGGLFQCQSFQCPSGTQCKVYEDGSSNCVSKSKGCPAHSLYTDCLPSCLPSCSNPNGLCEGISTKAPSTCKEGCVCRPGFLFSDNKCVLKDQCGCKDAQGDSIPAGKTWISSGCTQSCTCVAGAVQCRNFVCPTGSHCQHSDDGSSNCAVNKLEKCTAFFDGFDYRFPGRMNYYLIKTVDKLPEGIEPLVTEGRNKISPKGSPALHEVTTIVYGYKIQLQKGLVVLVNDQKVAIPYSPNHHLRVILRAQRLFLITDFEMVVDFDGKQTAVISLPTVYRGLIRGLCGNYDKNQANDFMLPNGMLTSNINAFGNSWEVKVVEVLFRSPRQPLAIPTSGPCQTMEEEKSPSFCALGFQNITTPCLFLTWIPEIKQLLILSRQALSQLSHIPSSQPLTLGSFPARPDLLAPLSNSTPTPPFPLYPRHCMSDMCSSWKTKDEEELRCRVLSGYAILCQEAGVNMTGWRGQTHCAMTCPANTVYQSCMTPCPASCAKFVTPKVCDGPCVEGCAAIPGYIYSDTQSLPVTHCGCSTNGTYYKLGDSFVTDDCSQHCTCASQGILQCEPYGCRAGESCTVANFTRGCFRGEPG